MDPGCVPAMKASEIAPGVPSRLRLAGSLVDGHEDDVARWLRTRRLLAIADPGLHDVDPDRERGLGAGLVVADRLLLIEADPDADRDVRIEADEPRVGVVVGRAGLAAERPVERGRLHAVPRRTTPSQQVRHDERRVGADRVLRLRTVLFEHVAFAIRDLDDRSRASSGRPGSERPSRRSSSPSAWPRRRRAPRPDTAEAATRSPSRRAYRITCCGPSCSITRTAGTLRESSSARRSVIGPSNFRS